MKEAELIDLALSDAIAYNLDWLSCMENATSPEDEEAKQWTRKRITGMRALLQKRKKSCPPKMDPPT